MPVVISGLPGGQCESKRYGRLGNSRGQRGSGTDSCGGRVVAERLHTDVGGKDAPSLHKAMVELALHGYDVQLSAVHFAATSLAMLNPDI